MIYFRFKICIWWFSNLSRIFHSLPYLPFFGWSLSFLKACLVCSWEWVIVLQTQWVWSCMVISGCSLHFVTCDHDFSCFLEFYLWDFLEDVYQVHFPSDNMHLHMSRVQGLMYFKLKFWLGHFQVTKDLPILTSIHVTTVLKVRLLRGDRFQWQSR